MSAQFSSAERPAGDSAGNEHPALPRIRSVSTLLDESIRVPGTSIRIGLDPILGILPVAGDFVSLLVSAYIIFEGYRTDAPRRLLAKLIALAAVDFVIGSIPVVGPVFDAFWKNNKWSVGLLEDHLAQPRSP